MEHCPNCGGELKIIAAILEQPAIEKILTHLGLQARAPATASGFSRAIGRQASVMRAGRVATRRRGPATTPVTSSRDGRTR